VLLLTFCNQPFQRVVHIVLLVIHYHLKVNGSK
jgi:hypothetical protein